MKSVYNYFREEAGIENEKEIEKEILNRLYIIGEKERYNAIIEKNYIVRFCSKNFIDITNKIVKQSDNLALK